MLNIRNRMCFFFFTRQIKLTKRKINRPPLLPKKYKIKHTKENQKDKNYTLFL